MKAPEKSLSACRGSGTDWPSTGVPHAGDDVPIVSLSPNRQLCRFLIVARLRRRHAHQIVAWKGSGISASSEQFV
jgi:hypothetical protein